MRWILSLSTLLAALTGCGSKPSDPQTPSVAVKQTPDAPGRSSGTEASPSAPTTTEIAPPAVTPAQPDLQPPIESTSVIDFVAEGQLYRQALESYERGELTMVEDARDQLLQDRHYQPLGQALDALLHSSRGAQERAMEIVEELSTSELMQTESFVIAGEVFRQQGDLTAAIACLRNAVQRNPAHATAHRWLGAIHFDTGAMVLATEHFRAAANADSGDGQSLIQSGQIHYEFHGYQSAVEDFRRALQRNLDQVTQVAVRIQLADALLALEQPDQALEAIQTCDAIATVLAVRGECHLANGKVAEATRHADEALEQSPHDRRALLLRSRLFMDEQHYPEATPLLEKLVAADAEDFAALQLLLDCVSRSDSPERANQLERQVNQLQVFRRRIEELKLKAVDQPQDAQVRAQLAEVYEAHGRVSDAIHWYEAAIGLDATLQFARDKVHQLQHPLPPVETLPADDVSSSAAPNRS